VQALKYDSRLHSEPAMLPTGPTGSSGPMPVPQMSQPNSGSLNKAVPAPVSPATVLANLEAGFFEAKFLVA
jgi:hypothetical protein